MQYLKINNSAKPVLVDDEDFERLSKFTWYESASHTSIRIVRSEWQSGKVRQNRNIPLAAEVMQDSINMYDHKDRDIYNNQKLNLRIATHAQNSINKEKVSGCLHKYKGVQWMEKLKKWRAYITLNGKFVHLGTFVLEIDAAIAYNNAAIRHFGEFACINKIELASQV